MVITFLGGEFFKVQFGDTVLAFNPVSKHSKKLKPSRFGADVAFVSTNHDDMNGGDTLGIGDKQPFVISGPGEYEIKGVFIKGFPSESEYDGEKRINTIYSVSLEGMNLCFLGALSKEPKAEIMEGFDSIDILFVPIGGNGVFGPAEAAKFATKLEPKLIIPMHYSDIGDKNALKTFLKESGEEGVKPVDKLTLKKKDLEGKEGEVVVLEMQN